MNEIRIYLEGGGQDNASKRKIRNGFDAFLNPLRDLAREKRIQWIVIPCGPRNVAFENFKHGLTGYPDAFNVLLVDSEEQVSLPRWEHLRQRDRWQTAHLPEDRCHLMVCTVEAWLLADPDALAGYYGQGFRRNALPRREDVEAIPKDQLYASLERATSGTQKGSYHKIRHCVRRPPRPPEPGPGPPARQALRPPVSHPGSPDRWRRRMSSLYPFEMTEIVLPGGQPASNLP